MGSFRLEINPAGFNQARKDPRILAELMRRGMNAAEAAGGAPDFEAVDASGVTRARVIVRAVTPKGYAMESRNRSLTKAFEAARS